MVSNMTDITTAGGVLLVDKPSGVTSHDAVAHIRKILTRRGLRIKVGHTGTLDPFASGLLLVAVGPATRLCQFNLGAPKTYETQFILGAGSDTDDITGTITKKKAGKPSADQINHALNAFRGAILQAPPQYSAIKIRGRKMYEYARAGEKAPAAPRRVNIIDILITNYNYPRLDLKIICSSGTYIRALARDLGQALNSAGYVSKLRRVAIGKFNVKDATKLIDINDSNLEQLIRPALLLVRHLPTVTVDAVNVAKLRQGKVITPAASLPADDNIVIMSAPDNHLVGIGKYDNKNRRLFPTVILSVDR